MADLHDAKAALRRRAAAARRGLDPAARAAASAAICGHLETLPALDVTGADRALLGYAAAAHEASVDDLLRRRLAGGGRTALPRVDATALWLHQVADLGADLATGRRGIREPRPHLPAVAAADVAAVLVPGVAFDTAGRRLGQGGGFYDRLLARLAPGVALVGVAFSVQVVQAVPTEAHDRRVDVVVTEDGVLTRYRSADGADHRPSTT